MKKLSDSEIYNMYMSSTQKGNMGLAAKQKLDRLIHVISTSEHVDEPMLQLKNMKKSAYYPMMNQVFSMAHTTDQVIPFAFEKADIPQVIPYTVFKTHGNGSQKREGFRTYANLFRLGKWSADNSKFTISSLDLYSALESACMGHLMLIHGKKDTIINDTVVMETSARIYSKFMFKVIERIKKSINSDLYQDFTFFFCAKFFLLNVLGKQEGKLIDDIAHKACKYRTSLTSIKDMENSSKINYTSLVKFMASIGEFLDFGKIELRDLIQNWAKMYGEQTILMIEYFPFFMHFIFSGLRGSQTISNLARRRDEYERDASRMYSAVISKLN